MVDLDELGKLVAQMAPGPWVAPRVDVSTPAQGTPAPYALSITGQGPRMFTVDRCKYMHADDAAGIAALRNSAEELIRDARRWRALDAVMAEHGHQWTADGERAAEMLKILKEPT